MTFISDHLPASMTSLLLRLALVASSGILSASITCSGTCVFSAQETNVVALCYRSASLDEIKKDISSTENITELTVASSNISTITGGVFAGFTALRNLSLTFNNIHTIRARGFAGLNKLECLNMSDNRISTWEIDRDTELRSLVVLDISGNKALSNTLPPFILTLPSLRTVHGVTLNDNCQSCTLVKNYVIKNPEYSNEITNIETENLKQRSYLVGKRSHCRKTRHDVHNNTAFIASFGYLPLCLMNSKACFASQVTQTEEHLCWDTDNKILNIEYVIAVTGVVLNFTVVFITLWMKQLRGNATLLLVANMAASDFLISSYAIILTTLRKMAYSEFIGIFTGACSVLGYVWLTSQFVSVISSVLVTIERFLVIVFCQKPQFRMSVVTVRRLIVAAWGMGTTVALFPLVGIGTYAGNTFCVPIDPSRENPYTFYFSTSLTLFAIILYLITIPLYIKIFLFVRSNQLQRGVRKEGALAKKIAILVLSNMVFFFLPVFFAALLLLAPKMFKDFSMISMSLLTATVPTILTSINAMCNPLLYAFRHGHFIRALKICLGCTHSLDTFREHSSSFGSTSQKMEARRQTNCSG
ncbi:predicted protein [Nematostella vectensis]|uniref:G-protein coupled receptors family 1 profile domain-containing protein n=1 Tax=Nematostella vectensis TaxID=45351 RepID=A7T202_NEMVE|nr:predicted protein [Nematostella vectensis]|eukprot:XP_001622112.1 hypothetical protein NEMVEDRAFT_v1g221138 [Nematostella vectensis]